MSYSTHVHYTHTHTHTHTHMIYSTAAVMSSALAKKHNYRIDGALFDLGVSSHQIDQPERGFAYMSEGKLDMRMNQSSEVVSEEGSEEGSEEVSEEGSEGASKRVTALELVNNLSLDELEEILLKFGDEPLARVIATEIVLTRPLTTTTHLKDSICAVIPPKYQIKTLSRCFQALRIVVNNELSVLEEALAGVARVTKRGGRLVVLSYHSLEDRVIKDLFRQHGTKVKKKRVCSSDGSSGSSGSDGGGSSDTSSSETVKQWRPLFKKPIVPTREELKRNSRSRSAKLRVAERV
jgi:16S rRNA (cytosine1402-N4)-methyltransferase